MDLYCLGARRALNVFSNKKEELVKKETEERNIKQIGDFLESSSLAIQCDKHLNEIIIVELVFY